MAAELENELDRYDPEYPPDADERDMVEHDAAAERDELRRDLERERYWK